MDTDVYGHEAEPSDARQKNMRKLLFALAAVAVLIAESCIFVAVIKNGAKTGWPSRKTEAAEEKLDREENRDTEEARAEQTETPAAAAPAAASAAPAESLAPLPPTQQAVVTAAPVTAAPVTAAPVTAAPTVVPVSGRAYSIAYTTPSHLGVNLRREPGSSSAQVVTVPEGSLVLFTGGSDGDYVSVEYYGAGQRLSGWILRRYLSENYTGGDVYYGYNNKPTQQTVYVGYHTDDHLGVVLRGGPSSSSAHLGVLPEGTLLYLTGSVSGEYSSVSTTDGRAGWVMTKYLTR